MKITIIDGAIDASDYYQEALGNYVSDKEKSKALKWLNDKIKEHKKYIMENGDDMPFVKNWKKWY